MLDKIRFLETVKVKIWKNFTKELMQYEFVSEL